MNDLSLNQNPLHAVSRLQQQINQLFNSPASPGDDSSAATADWMPLVDIHEYENRFVLYVDTPGVDPKSVDITLEAGVLSIAGERGGPERDAQDDAARRIRLRTERGLGRFYRRFILPDSVEAEAVKARGRDGVLEIEIPKKEKAQPRRIKVAA